MRWPGSDWAELKPLAQQAFGRGSIDPMWLTFKDFEEDLQFSVDHPEAEPLNPDGDLALFGDDHRGIVRRDVFQPKASSDESGWGMPDAYGMPARDPRETSGATIPVPAAAAKTSRSVCLTQASAACSSWAFGGVKYRPHPRHSVRNRSMTCRTGPDFDRRSPFAVAHISFDRRIHLFNLTSPQRNISE